MKRTTLAALVAVAFSAPALSQTSNPTIAFTAPAVDGVLKGNVQGPPSCIVAGTNIARVMFYLNDTWTNTDGNLTNGLGCWIDTTKYRDGTYTLKAVAYNAAGRTATTTRQVRIQNAAPVNTPPTVSISAPSANQYVSGTISYSANASDNAGVARVEFFVDGNSVNNDSSAPYSGSINTNTLSNGAHTLRAVAYDAAGLSSSTQVSFNVQNTQASTLPTVAFTAPAVDGILKGNVQGPPSCIVEGANIARVMFYVNDVWTNTDGNLSNGLGCWIDTTKYKDGTYTVKAVAYNAAGQTATATRQVKIQNTVVPVNTPPVVSLTAPAANATISGTMAYAASATDNAGVSRVEFFVDGNLVHTDSAAPYAGSIDTRSWQNGSHVVRAVAYDAAGLSAASQITVNVNNAPAEPTLPAGGRSVSTFHSTGLYWTPSSNPGAAGCIVQYRKQGETAWKQGLNLWYDSRTNECRGSLVHLDPASTYDVQMGTGTTYAVQTTARTWNEQFPVAKTITVDSRSTTLTITEGGSPSGYVVYQAAPGAVIDVANAADWNVNVDASYVIVRGFTMRNARMDGVRIQPNRTDVVIEDNEITNWGRYSHTASNGWQIGVNMDSGIRAMCGSSPTLERIVVQRNRIHDPRYGSNSWSDGHPSGPNGILFSNCGGNHVFRHNSIRSSAGKYYMDVIGGEDNFSAKGMPNADSDIYGNDLGEAWDDAIEAEGANRNVRIWGNYFDNTAVGVASTATHSGPIYIWRNVYNRSRQLAAKTPDTDDRNAFGKSGSNSQYGHGRRYVFHNTLLQPMDPGNSYPSGAGGGIRGPSDAPMSNTVSRNNIWHVWKSHWYSVEQNSGGANNDVNYDLYNANIDVSGGQANGVRGTPIYAGGHGTGMSGLYQQATNSPGYDRGVRLNNFNDGFHGAAPDMGAHEALAPAMVFGTGSKTK